MNVAVPHDLHNLPPRPWVRWVPLGIGAVGFATPLLVFNLTRGPEPTTPMGAAAQFLETHRQPVPSGFECYPMRDGAHLCVGRPGVPILCHPVGPRFECHWDIAPETR